MIPLPMSAGRIPARVQVEWDEEADRKLLAERREHLTKIPEIREEEAKAAAGPDKLLTKTRKNLHEVIHKLSMDSSSLTATQRARRVAAVDLLRCDFTEAEYAAEMIHRPAQLTINRHETFLRHSAWPEIAVLHGKLAREYESTRHDVPCPTARRARILALTQDGKGSLAELQLTDLSRADTRAKLAELSHGLLGPQPEDAVPVPVPEEILVTRPAEPTPSRLAYIKT